MAWGSSYHAQAVARHVGHAAHPGIERFIKDRLHQADLHTIKSELIKAVEVMDRDGCEP